MKLLNQTVYASPKFSKFIEWGKLITITGSAQIVIQAISFLSGILVIRILPAQEYALYILVNTMLGTMIVLADGGITTGVMAQGGKVWQNRVQLGSVIVTGLELRKKFAIGSLLVVVPALLFLLRHHGANWLMSFLVIISLIPAFFSALSGTLLEVAPKLNQDIQSLQKIQVGTNIGRIVILVLALFTFPYAFVAVLASGIPQIWSNIRLRKISDHYVDRSQDSSPIVQKEILTVVKKILPGAIYFCLSGQITIWLISLFGSTNAVAQIGALGRLAMVLNLFMVIFSTLIIPRFARLPDVMRKILLLRFIQMQFGVLLISICIIGLVVLFPVQILSILGKTYADLTSELVIMALVSCMGMMVGVTYSATISRGLILSPVINISGHLLTQLIFVSILDLSKPTDVLLLSLADHSIAFIMLTTNFIIKISRSKTKSAYN